VLHGELLIPATATGLLPLNLSTLLRTTGYAVEEMGHLPLKIAHEGCGASLATVVTRDVLEEQERRAGGCCGARVVEETRCLYRHRCIGCGVQVAFYEWKRAGVAAKQGRAQLANTSRRVDYGGSVMGASLGLLPANVDPRAKQAAMAKRDSQRKMPMGPMK